MRKSKGRDKNRALKHGWAARLRQKRIAQAVQLAFALGASAAAMPVAAQACNPNVTSDYTVLGAESNFGSCTIVPPSTLTISGTGSLDNFGILDNSISTGGPSATLNNAGTL